MQKMFTADFISKTDGYVRRAIFADDKVIATQIADRMAEETGEHLRFASVREVQGEFEIPRYAYWIAQDDSFTKFSCSHCMSHNHEVRHKRCPECGAYMSDQAYTPKPHFQP